MSCSEAKTNNISIGETMLIQDSSIQYLAKKAANILFETTSRLLQEKKEVVIAVPGGNSVAAIYDIFQEFTLPWDRIHLFLLDERLVPVDHRESNYRLIREHMGKTIGAVFIHPFIYDVKDPLQCIVNYREELNRCGGQFDIVLASSGEDGHIGSLFPNHRLLEESRDDFFLLDDSPKAPAERMAAGLELIRQADSGILLFFGSSKREALQRFQDTELSYKECPAKVMTELAYHYILTDQEEHTV